MKDILSIIFPIIRLCMDKYNIEFYYCGVHDCGVATVMSKEKYYFPDCNCEASIYNGAYLCGKLDLEIDGTCIEETDIKKNIETYADNSGWKFKYTQLVIDPKLVIDPQLNDAFYKWIKSKMNE